MGESSQAICVLLLMVSAIAAPVVWTHDDPSPAAWFFRIVCPTCAVLSLGLILTSIFRKDTVPDYLRGLFRKYFNRDGFCFGVVATSVDGIAYLNAYFQNQYEKPCIGRIALRPARGFLMGRAKIETITYEIECDPAAFGFVRIAIPAPEKIQGKYQSFDVGASVEYPEGKGRRVRFHDGIFLRHNTKFRSAFSTALNIAGTATGHIVFFKPEKTKIKIPPEVAEDIPNDIAPETKTLWRLGDPTLSMTE